MSRLIDRLNNLNKTALPAMGFRKAGAEEKHMSMLVLTELSGRPDDEIREIAGSGIAGGLIDGVGLSSAALSRLLKNADNLIVGLALMGSKAGSGFKLISYDIDFVVLDTNLPVAAFGDRDVDRIGKVLRVDMGIEAGLLRSVHNVYPCIDAVMLDLRMPTLTMENMMGCRRVSDFSGQHIAALVNKSLPAVELIALRDAGVKALVLPLDTTAAELKSIVDDVSSLPKQEKKNEKKAVALLPQLGMAPAPKEEDEGDDDGE